MKSLLFYFLEAWYSDIRRNVRADISSKVNNAIRVFANADPELLEIVNLAKKSGAAARAKLHRSQVRLNLARTKRRGSSLLHIPCKKARK